MQPRQWFQTLTAVAQNAAWLIKFNTNTMYIQPLSEGSYFHIYNRSVDGEDIFKEQRNYCYFIRQYITYCFDVMDTFAYALLKNHFHLLVYIKENVPVPKHNGDGLMLLNASKQLSHFFYSYSQSVNKASKRTGPLIESPFRRKLVDDDSCFTSLIFPAITILNCTAL